MIAKFNRLLIVVCIWYSSVNAVDTGRPHFVDSASGTEIYLNEPSPQFLYHWTLFSVLGAIAYRKQFSDKLTRFGDGVANSSAHIYWPSLDKSKFGALFSWIHPVTAIKGGDWNENYGIALLKLEIDTRRARVIRLVEKWKNGIGPSESLFDNLDLSKYDIVIRESEKIKEVIVLNPDIVVGFTADPKVLSTELEHELKRLKNNNFNYPLELIHFDLFKADAKNRKDFRDYAIHTIEDLLKNGRKYVPSFFLRDLRGQPTAPWENIQDTLKRIEEKEYPLNISKMRREAQIHRRYGQYDMRDLMREIIWTLYENQDQFELYELLRPIVESYDFRVFSAAIPSSTALELRARVFNENNLIGNPVAVAAEVIRLILATSRSSFAESIRNNISITTWLDQPSLYSRTQGTCGEILGY